MTQAKKNTSLVRNPASRMTLGSKKRKTAVRKTAARRNLTKQVRSRRRYRRNPASAGAMSLITAFLGAGLGALIINLFDFGVNRVSPNTGAAVRTGVKAAIGAGLLLFGNKLPFGRSYAPMVGGAFVLASALDAVGTWVMPQISGLISPAQPQPIGQVQNPATGEMGLAFRLPNGDIAEVYNPPVQQYSDGYGIQRELAIV